MAKTADLAALHKKSSRNRSLLAGSTICACFYCFSEYKFDRIDKWTDEDETAICPVCGVDAVLGFDSAPPDQKLLQAMHDRWFKAATRLKPDEWKDAVERNAWRDKPRNPSDRK